MLLRKLAGNCTTGYRAKLSDSSEEHAYVYFVRPYPVGVRLGTCPDREQMANEVDKPEGNAGQTCRSTVSLRG